ncbi:hypothetical protein JI739_11050 [Ramlibacter sp. AW1]|uniref:Uncharacterized protein n=1 Tax=Ramlibacter aurantiacus TaxID=2801330 RepID=A0A936ZIK3_9BURK|nr:hypothetical protein [Ramlibacter aurantiacus]MBL0420883.1 hypothetical protein [Ramlibacter aurantiacus]
MTSRESAQATPFRAQPFRCTAVRGSCIHTSCGTLVYRSAGLPLPTAGQVFYARHNRRSGCWAQVSA